MVKRREVLRGAAALPVLPALAAATPALEADAKKKKRKHKKKTRSLAGMNVVLFITDQQREIMHFPKDWAKKNLPGMTRLEKHAVKFTHACCNSCMCSPSRATLLTGYFPAQHGVKYTLEEDMSTPPYPQVELPLDLPNISTVMSAAGYHVPFKGKWHLSKKTEADWVPQDVNQYGFERWDPPDAGANQDLDQYGGGDADNDGRYIDDDGAVEVGHEGVLEYLTSAAAQEQPFFLIVSLVNPHDVLGYPSQYINGGYDDSDLEGNIGLPQTVNEDLSTKPSAQAQFLNISSLGLGVLTTNQEKINYLNFYGNLMKESDAYLVDILDTLDAQGLTNNTVVIQTSDHGEMGMTHGGMRQKSFNFYEETLRVPLIFSNPKLYKGLKKNSSLVSHVDFLPTIATLFGAPDSAKADWEGVDYSRIVKKPKKKGKQKYIVFTYDDWQAGQPVNPLGYVDPPNHITSIREGRYKLAKYYDEFGIEPDQWEMYDLKQDPNEEINIANPDYKPSKSQQKELNRLKNKLADVESTRLQPLSGARAAGGKSQQNGKDKANGNGKNKDKGKSGNGKRKERQRQAA